MRKSGTKKYSRRGFLKTAIAGAGGLATLSVVGSCDRGSYIDGSQGIAAHSIPINSGWRFGEYKDRSTNPDFDDSAFEQVTLPHTVTDLSWREWNPKSWEKMWIYRRNFTIDEDLSDKRVFLDFGAAMIAATIILNGQKVGKNVDGYLPFSFEITDYLKEGENKLAVKLDSGWDVNTPPNRPGRNTTEIDFWQPGGLYRDAHIRIVPEIFLSDVFAKPVDVLTDNRRLELECTVDTSVLPENALKIGAELLKGDESISTTSASFKMDVEGQKTFNLVLENLNEVELWDVDNPNLYNVVVTLAVDGEAIHDYAIRTGFREAKFKKDGFYLNGDRLQIFGLNRHHSYPFIGNAMPPRVQRKDAEILRNDLNCNMVRCSHYPQAESFLDACDELGLLVFDEIPGWGMWLGDEEWKERVVRNAEELVRKHRNHPSIVIWGVRMNETPDDIEMNTKSRDIAHKLDDSRQTTGSIGAWDHDTEEFVQDVFSLNDYSSREDKNGIQWPELRAPREDFPYLVSEAIGTLSGPAKVYRRNISAFKQQGQAEAHAIAHNIAGSDKGYSGLVAWCGYDYISGNGNRHEGIKYPGVIDMFRVPKLGAAIYKSQVDPRSRPVIAPAFYWDFNPDALPFEEGQKAMICSNCERLELYVDDKHFATVHPAADRFAYLPYPPSFVDLNNIDGSVNPELRIEGYVDDEEVIRRSFSSGTSEDELLLKVDDEELTADGSDTTRVVFRAVDKFGAPRPYVDGDLKLTLKGPAILIGENPFAFEDTGGVGAVWVRTQADKRGQIILRAEHPGLGSAEVQITAT